MSFLILMRQKGGNMEHVESTDCWCCPIIVKEIDTSGNVVEIVVHNEREEAN